MKLTMPLALVVVGAAVASAQPKQEKPKGRVILKERAKPAPPAGWTELAEPTPASSGTSFVVVGKEKGAFASLRIDTTKGRVIVKRVRVFFDDGKVMTDEQRAILDDKRKSFVISFGEGKLIDRVVVATETYTDGQYAIYGAPVTLVAGR